MALPPGQNPSGRKPTLKGVVQQDVSRGQPRTRVWPRKRPGPPTAEQRRVRTVFAEIQKAAKFVAPIQYKWLYDQTQDSPLLPRDVFTMMMTGRLYAFDLPDGKTLWPMAAKRTISEALDIISATPGDTLVRGPETWEGTSGGGGGGGGLNLHLMELAGGNVSLGTGDLEIPVDTLVANPAGWCDVANNNFSPDQPGWYCIVGHSYSTSSDVTQLRTGKNGLFYSYASVYTGSREPAFLGVGFVPLNGNGDTVSMLMNATSSGTYYGSLRRNWQALLGPL